MTELKKITRISYSYLHLMACPYAAFLRYEAQIRPPQTEYSARGTALHTALEREHQGSKFNLNNAVLIFKDEFKKIVDEDEIFVAWPKFKKMEGEGINYLEAYAIGLEAGQFPAPTFVEFEFSLFFDDFEIVGKLDVVEFDDDGEITVVDYKSGSAKPDLWMLKHNLQFTAYAWAIYEKYGKLPKKLVWHHLKTGERLETVRSLQDIDQLKQMVRNVLGMNREGVRHRIFHEKICDLCEYSGTRGRKDSICDDTELEKTLVEVSVVDRH